MSRQQRQTISTPEAPAASGPYCQGVLAGGFLFVSGQLPLDPASGQISGETIEAQTERVIANLEAICRAAGGGLADVVKTTVFLADMRQFGRFNQVYERCFGLAKPARSTLQAAALPKGAAVMIDAVACLGQD